VAGRIVVRWEFDSSRGDFENHSLERKRLRRLFMMRKIALTLAFLAIASIVVLVLVVIFSAQNS